MKCQKYSPNSIRPLTKHDKKAKIRLFSGLIKAEIRSQISLKRHAQNQTSNRLKKPCNFTVNWKDYKANA